MKTARTDSLSGPGRNAAAVVLAACGVLSICWAISSERSAARTAAHAQVPAASVRAAPPAPRPSPKSVAVAAIDINTAPPAQLELLPGVGVALARRIVDYREQHGAFESIDDLDKVSGIGPRMLAKIRPFAAVAPVAKPAE